MSTFCSVGMTTPSATTQRRIYHLQELLDALHTVLETLSALRERSISHFDGHEGDKTEAYQRFGRSTDVADVVWRVCKNATRFYVSYIETENNMHKYPLVIQRFQSSFENLFVVVCNDWLKYTEFNDDKPRIQCTHIKTVKDVATHVERDQVSDFPTALAEIARDVLEVDGETDIDSWRA